MDEDEEDKDNEEDSLLISQEPIRMITKLILAKFTALKRSGYRPTNGQTDRLTDGWTDWRMDTPSYRDAWTHLKISWKCEKNTSCTLGKEDAYQQNKVKYGPTQYTGMTCKDNKN